jgi:hypothetical protein
MTGVRSRPRPASTARPTIGVSKRCSATGQCPDSLSRGLEGRDARLEGLVELSVFDLSVGLLALVEDKDAARQLLDRRVDVGMSGAQLEQRLRLSARRNSSEDLR